jgi:Glycosyl hydrolase family 12
MGSCGCPQGQAVCGTGACQDVQSDEANCGACNAVCVAGSTCTAGVCLCANGQTACAASNACKDLTSDPQNCGSCGNVCGGSTQCLFGGCVDPNSVNCGSTAHNDEKCDTDNQGNPSNTLGPYRVSNNLWGANNGSGMQCIWNSCANGDLVGWGTSWNWTGQANSVKSYAALIYGWHWTATGALNVQVSSSTKVNCGWAYTVTLNGGTDTMNVAYDMWVHTGANPGTNSNPSDEIMVWLYRNNGAGPIGSKVNGNTPIPIGGHSWDLYEGTTTLAVHSFVRTSNATTAVLDMMAFPRYLVQSRGFSNSKYVSSVEAGTEVFIGEAQLQTNGFYCRKQ